jgi:hypothetical protein
MGLAIFFTFPNLVELGLTRHTRRKSEPSRDDLPSMDDSLPPSTKSKSHHTLTMRGKTSCLSCNDYFLFISYEAILCPIVGWPNHLRGLPAVGPTRAAVRRQRGRR